MNRASVIRIRVIATWLANQNARGLHVTNSDLTGRQPAMSYEPVLLVLLTGSDRNHWNYLPRRVCELLDCLELRVGVSTFSPTGPTLP